MTRKHFRAFKIVVVVFFNLFSCSKINSTRHDQISILHESFGVVEISNILINDVKSTLFYKSSKKEVLSMTHIKIDGETSVIIKNSHIESNFIEKLKLCDLYFTELNKVYKQSFTFTINGLIESLNDSDSLIACVSPTNNEEIFNIIACLLIRDNRLVLNNTYFNNYSRFKMDWCYFGNYGSMNYPKHGMEKEKIIEGIQNAFN